MSDRIAAERFGKVAVLTGGWSAEREVSLNSGAAVLAALQACGVDAFAVDVPRAQLGEALVNRCDRVFNILHGTWGEDGCIQGFLETLGIPYTGSGVLASSLSMDKHLTKTVCQRYGVDTPQWSCVDTEAECRRAAEQIGFPVVVKPVSEGSSIGVSIVQDNELSSAYELAAGYGEVLVEQYIDGSEITAAILDGDSLPLVRITTPNAFYDYNAKYEEDTTVYDCPCGLDERAEAVIRETAMQVFSALQCSGWGRVDFLLDSHGKHYLLEVNTAPGMTDHSLVPMAARAAGLSFEELVMRILTTTLDSDSE